MTKFQDGPPWLPGAPGPGKMDILWEGGKASRPGGNWERLALLLALAGPDGSVTAYNMARKPEGKEQGGNPGPGAAMAGKPEGKEER